MTKNTILLSVLLLIQPILAKSHDKIISLDALSSLVIDYIDNPCKKNALPDSIKNDIPLEEVGYAKIALEDKSHYFRILAMIAYEKNDWFEEKPLEFIKMAIDSSQNETDSIASYRQIIPAYVEKIYNEFDIEKKKKIKSELDDYYEEIKNWKSNSNDVEDLKYKAKHNMGIVERQMLNFDGAIDLFNCVDNTQIDFNDYKMYKLELKSNTINELGRAYLSKGIFENKDEFIDTAIVKFNQAIEMLESNSCAPAHLNELYERKKKALRLINRYIDAKKMDYAIHRFQLKPCFKGKWKLRMIFQNFHTQNRQLIKEKS